MDTKQEPKSCARIEEVGITTGRDGLPAEAEGRIQIQADESRCKHCGKEIVQIAKRKKRIFCSDVCRQKWWNSHLFMISQSSQAFHHFICPTCKKPFTVYSNAKRKFCSHHCYIHSRYY